MQTRQGSVVSESSSWLGYIGLGSSSTVVLPSSPLSDTPSSTAESQPLTPELPSGVIAPNPPAPTETPIELSIGSTESAAAWYAPWRWYDGTAIRSVIEPVGTGKSQAELVKEEALARPEPSAQSFLPPPDPSKQPDPAISSVESRASWFSIFSPQGFSNVRAITENAIVGGVKSHSDADPAVPPSETSSLSVPNTNSPPSAISIGPPEPPKRPPSLPPLTKDDDIKKQAQFSERSRSLSPKKFSQPRPANLVLPTFEDTFGTPPRSIPISQSGSTIRRAIRYVSGILFPEEDKRGNGKSTEPQVDKTRDELPRTWGVLGEQELIASGGLIGVKRVVVIGVHGWFPRKSAALIWKVFSEMRIP